MMNIQFHPRLDDSIDVSHDTTDMKAENPDTPLPSYQADPTPTDSGESFSSQISVADTYIEQQDLPADSGIEQPLPTLTKTEMEFDQAIQKCRNLFRKKLSDYGTSWRIMRPSSLTDQIMIKARRIRSLEEKEGKSAVAEGIAPEYVAIVNYAVIALIQLQLGTPESLSDHTLAPDVVMRLYDQTIEGATGLMLNKNHDYDEAWRDMRISSFTDIILQKILRTKGIENHNGQTLVSEGVDANYMDMINYSLFALIKLHESE